MPVNSMTLTIGEILQKVKDADSKADRLKILKDNESWPLKHFLRLAFDPNIRMTLNDGCPKFTANPKPVGFGDTTLRTVLGGGNKSSGFYVFFHKSSPNLRQSKRDLLFILLLEQLDRQEAGFLLDAKDKKLDIGLTRKAIDEVFPGLLSAESEVADQSEKTDETKEEAPSNS